MSSGEYLKPPQDILRVVETFSEARSLLGEFAGREIGAICLKGVAKGSPREFWDEYGELRTFAYDATDATKGALTNDFTLELRRKPRGTPVLSQGCITVFRRDIAMHFDGEYTETFDQAGNSIVTSKHPLIAEEYYLGASHHITRSRGTTFVMDQLSHNKVMQLARCQPHGNTGVVDTNPFCHPTRGEAIELEDGDYMALHSYAVYKRPVYVHGTINSSLDRSSIAFNPIPIATTATPTFPDLRDLMLIEYVDLPLEPAEPVAALSRA